MALTFDLTNVANREEVCYTGKGDKARYNPITERIIWTTMIVDIGEITKDNAMDFYARSHLMDDIYGWRHGNGSRPLSLAEVEAHVGLKTNVANLTRSKWLAKIAKHHLTARLRDYERDAKQAIRKDTCDGCNAVVDPATLTQHYTAEEGDFQFCPSCRTA